MLNPKYLKTFTTLVETGSFTKTAERLFMTQPGVSQHVKKLEQSCGSELLVRLGKGIELTEQGRQVYRYAREDEARQQQFLEQLKFDEPHQGHCTLACSGAVAQRIYPGLTALQAKHPALAIHLEVAPRHRIVESLKQGEIDIGIVTNIPADESLIAEYLAEEVLHLFLPATITNFTSINTTLNQLGLVDHPDAAHYLQLYCNHCGEERLASLEVAKLKRSGYVNQLSQILLPVSAGVGFTVLPASVEKHAGHGSNIAVYPAASTVSEPLYLVRSRHRNLPARYAGVSEVIYAAFQQS
ncbi:MAG TPA: LysR family transcriptional regulator, partial [Alteromonas sp.]|nr:LysR family transcriptional regulator [Alteromonas sp.]|tara:strand:+ start:1262 stop:2155 length:894 start_codon:yes stop_codon:yes gene_type:complete